MFPPKVIGRIIDSYVGVLEHLVVHDEHTAPVLVGEVVLVAVVSKAT